MYFLANRKIYSTYITLWNRRPSTDIKITKKKFFSEYDMNISLFSVGIFSRIEEQKGQHLVIEAIKQSKHDIQLFIIGHCMDEKYRKKFD